MKPVYILRGGAPDKANLSSDKYNYIKLNNTNLVDLAPDYIDKICSLGYVLPADEGDIKYCNKCSINYHNVLLPRTAAGIIDYGIVHKDSYIYKNIMQDTMNRNEYSCTIHTTPKLDTSNIFNYIKQEAIRFIEDGNDITIKTTTGSGSRGVIVVDREMASAGVFNYHSEISEDMFNKLEVFYNKEKLINKDCKLVIERTLPVYKAFHKVNCDFIIKDCELKYYKFDIPEGNCNFTNWDWLTVVRNSITDKIMSTISKYLIGHGITDAIMNFEGFIDNYANEDKKFDFYLIEFNWRYSNSMFESLALGVNMIDTYIDGLIPDVSSQPKLTRIVRSWLPVKYDSLNMSGD